MQELLLILNIPINGHKDIYLTKIQFVQKCAIMIACQTYLWDSPDFMFPEERCYPFGKTLINDDFHCSGSLSAFNGYFRTLKNMPDLFKRDGWKVCKKIFDRLPCQQIIKQIANRYTRSSKYG